jgi:hypothetical protein
MKVFEKLVKLQGQGLEVKNFGIQKEGLVLRNAHMKSLHLTFKRYGQC